MNVCDSQIESATSYRTVLFESSKSLILLFFTFHVLSAFRSPSLKFDKFAVPALLALVAIHSGSNYAILLALLRCNDSVVKILDGFRVLTEFITLPCACALVYYILTMKYVESASKSVKLIPWIFGFLSAAFLVISLVYEIGSLISVEAVRYSDALSLLLSVLAILTAGSTIFITYQQNYNFQNVLIAAMTVLISTINTLGPFIYSNSDISIQFISLLLILQSISLIHMVDSKSLPLKNHDKGLDFDFPTTTGPAKTTIPRNRLSIISTSPQSLNEMLNQKTAGSTQAAVIAPQNAVSQNVAPPVNSMQRPQRANSIVTNSITFTELSLNDNTEYRPKPESAASNAAKLKRRSTLVLDQNAVANSEFKIPNLRSSSPTEMKTHFESEVSSSPPANTGSIPPNRAKRMSTYLSYPPSSM